MESLSPSKTTLKRSEIFTICMIALTSYIAYFSLKSIVLETSQSYAQNTLFVEMCKQECALHGHEIWQGTKETFSCIKECMKNN